MSFLIAIFVCLGFLVLVFLFQHTPTDMAANQPTVEIETVVDVVSEPYKMDLQSLKLKPSCSGVLMTDGECLDAGSRAVYKHWPTYALAINGCSMSTITIGDICNMLVRHGVPLTCLTKTEMPSLPQKNLLKQREKHNPKYAGFTREDWTFAQVQEILNTRLTDGYMRTSSLLFKLGLNEETDKSVLQFYDEHNIMTVHAARKNDLDRIICRTRDCFNQHYYGDSDKRMSEYTYPVFANGTRANFCFDRREKDIPTFAKIDISVLAQDIKEQTWANLPLYNLKDGLDRRLVHATEDLYLFQNSFDDAALIKSIETWRRLLSDLNIVMNDEIWWAMMGDRQGTRPLASHKSVIYNWEEVRDFLQGTPWEHQWRD
jgi:hypothetical protein